MFINQSRGNIGLGFCCKCLQSIWQNEDEPVLMGMCTFPFLQITALLFCFDFCWLDTIREVSVTLVVLPMELRLVPSGLGQGECGHW